MQTDQAYVLNDMLRGTIRGGTATSAARAAGLTVPSAGKSGTTNDYTDVWFVGYTRELVSGIWIGFDQPQTIKPGAQGGRLAAPAWAAFMREVYERRPSPGDWIMPIGAQRLLDAQAGIVPAPGPTPIPTPTPKRSPGT